MLAVCLALGLVAHAAGDTDIYRYEDGDGNEVLVQGLDQVPAKHRGSAVQVVVGPHYGGKAKPKPPPPPVVTAPAAGSPCAPTEAASYWRALIPKEPVRRWISLVSIAASVLLAVWLFRVIKLAVWLRALITMAPTITVVALLWIVTDRIAASRARRAVVACGGATGKPDLVDKLLDGHTRHLDHMDKAIERETGK